MSNNMVDDYGWSTPKAPNSCGYIAPRIIEILQHFQAKRVLDLGSGNGALCAEIASIGIQVAGMEYDQKGVETSIKSYPGIQFYQLGVQDSPSDLLRHEELFDAVVSTEVIEHLFSPHLLPIFAESCLKQNGHLIITTPYHGYLKNLALSILGKWDIHHNPLWHGGHIKFWSKKTMTQLLSKNGFQVVAFSGVGRIPFLWKSMVVVAKKTV